MNNNFDARLKEIIVSNSLKEIKKDDINDESDLINDLGFDSVQIVQMILELENEFNININDEDIQLDLLTKYGKLRNLILKKVVSLNF